MYESISSVLSFIGKYTLQQSKQSTFNYKWILRRISKIVLAELLIKQLVGQCSNII